MTLAAKSELCLEVRISAAQGEPNEFENAAGKIWRAKSDELPANWATQSLWSRLVESWPRRREILIDAGADLGRWLFRAEGVCEYLRGRVEQRAEDQKIQATMEEMVEELRKNRRLNGNTRVEILERLEPFEEIYLAEFLEDTLNFDSDRAETVAANLVDIYDNETILSRLRNFLVDLET